MKYNDLIDFYGSVTEAGNAINKRRQTVHRWRGSGLIPLEHQIAFELATSGKLRADLPDAFITVAAKRLRERRIKTRRGLRGKR